MNKEQFAKELVKVIQLRLGEAYSVESHYVTKNNGVKLLAVIIRENHQTVCPTIYIDGYYEEYCKGRDVLYIACDMIDSFRSYNNYSESDFFEDLRCLPKNIKCKLINTEANRLLLDNAPHKEWNDLSIIYYLDMGVEDGFHKSMTITNMLMEALGLNLNELERLANRNMEQPHIESMLSIMLRASGLHDMFGVNDFIENSNNMYVITNEEKWNGAICALQKDILKNFAIQKNVEKIFMIPSSLHEMILVLDNGDLCAQELNQIIREVNQDPDCLDPQEVLSTHCYIYNRQTDSISVA